MNTKTGYAPTFEAVQIFQPLPLMHISMEWQRCALKKCEDRHQSPDTVLAVTKHQGPLGVLLQEVIEVEVLLFQTTVDTGFSQGCGCALFLGEVDDLGLLFHAYFTHQHLCSHRNTEAVRKEKKNTEVKMSTIIKM